MNKKIKASVIIRSYNEEKNIGKCLSVIFSQAFRNFEVIIVDSESADRTAEIASKFGARIIKIQKKDFTYGRALNLGCGAAKGEYLVFLSAHAFPLNKFWLGTLLNGFTSENIAGVYGKQIPMPGCNPLVTRKIEAQWKNEKKMQYNSPFFANTNAAIPRRLWEKIRFDEGIPYAEDHEWVKRAQKKGYAILYEPKAVVYHSHNENLKMAASRVYKEACSTMLIYNKSRVFHYLIDAPYNFFQDCRYIAKKRLSPSWAVASFFTNILLAFASAAAFFKVLFSKSWPKHINISL